MPTKPSRPCRNRACPQLTNDSSGYCEQHKKQAQQQQDRERGTAAERGYDGRWRRIRAMVLTEEPLCRECMKTNRVTAASEVDHIDGNVHNMSRSNLQPLCGYHHKVKTAKENGSFGRPKVI